MASMDLNKPYEIRTMETNAQIKYSKRTNRTLNIGNFNKTKGHLGSVWWEKAILSYLNNEKAKIDEVIKQKC